MLACHRSRLRTVSVRERSTVDRIGTEVLELTVVGFADLWAHGAWSTKLHQGSVQRRRCLSWGGTLAARPRLGSRRVKCRLVDRTSHETLNEDSDEPSDAGGVELAMDSMLPQSRIAMRHQAESGGFSKT